MQDKKGITIYNAFQKISDASNRRLAKSKGRKSIKIWLDKGSEFYNRSTRSWLEQNDIEMDSAHNEAQSVAAERFVRTLKDKSYMCMTLISKMCLLIN